MHLWAMVLLVYSITVGGSIQPMSSKFAADDPPYGPYMKILWLGSLGPPTRPAHDDHDVTPGCSRHNTMEWKTMTRCFTVIRIHTWTLVVRRLCFYKANPLENVFQQTGLESVFVGKHNKTFLQKWFGYQHEWYLWLCVFSPLEWCWTKNQYIII